MNGLQGTINFFAVAAYSGGQGGYFSPHLVGVYWCADGLGVYGSMYLGVYGCVGIYECLWMPMAGYA